MEKALVGDRWRVFFDTTHVYNQFSTYRNVYSFGQYMAWWKIPGTATEPPKFLQQVTYSWPLEIFNVRWQENDRLENYFVFQMHLVSPCALFQMVKAFGQHPGVAKSRCGHNSLICFVCVAGNGKRSSVWVWRVWIVSPFFPCLWSHENGTVFYDFMSLVIGKTWKEQDQQGRTEQTERTERRGSRFQFGVH